MPERSLTRSYRRNVFNLPRVTCGETVKVSAGLSVITQQARLSLELFIGSPNPWELFIGSPNPWSLSLADSNLSELFIRERV